MRGRGRGMLSFSVTAFCSGTFTPPSLSFAPFASVGSFLGGLSSSELVGSVSAGFLGASSSLAASPATDIFRSLALQALTAWSASSCCRASAGPFPSSLRCHSRSSLALPLASLFAWRWPDDVLLLLVLHRLVDLLSSGMVCRRGVRSGLKNCDAGFEPEMATAPTILAVIAGATTRVHPALATRALY